MSGKQRLDIANAIYYVELKNSSNRPLFDSREAFGEFISLLEKLHDTLHTSTLCYCLLQDSVHLILKSGPEGIVESSRWLTQQYTQSYNQQHNRSGSVFNSHHLCLLLEPRRYLLDAARQLHQLPVTNKLVASPDIYPWSSHIHYLENQLPHWLESQPLISLAGNNRRNWLHRYTQLMSQPPQEALEWLSGCHSKYRALASDQYIRELQQSQEAIQSTPPSLEWLKQEVCDAYMLEGKDLLLWRRHRLAGEVKAVIAALALTFKTADLEEIARFLEEDQELLKNSIRSLDSHRGLFLRTLQLKLEKKLTAADPNTQEVPILVESPEEGSSDGNGESAIS